MRLLDIVFLSASLAGVVAAIPAAMPNANANANLNDIIDGVRQRTKGKAPEPPAQRAPLVPVAYVGRPAALHARLILVTEDEERFTLDVPMVDEPAGWSEEELAKLAVERASKVNFDRKIIAFGYDTEGSLASDVHCSMFDSSAMKLVDGGKKDADDTWAENDGVVSANGSRFYRNFKTDFQAVSPATAPVSAICWALY